MKVGLRVAWRQNNGGAELRDGPFKVPRLQKPHSGVSVKSSSLQVGFIRADLCPQAGFPGSPLAIAPLPSYRGERGVGAREIRLQTSRLLEGSRCLLQLTLLL